MLDSIYKGSAGVAGKKAENPFIIQKIKGGLKPFVVFRL